MAAKKSDEQKSLTPAPLPKGEGEELKGDGETAGPELVRLVRDEPQHAGGPSTADVHPDELVGWIMQGWHRPPDESAA